MSDGVPIARFDGGGCCGSSSSAAGASDGADDGRAGASDGDDRKRKRPWQEEGFRCPFLDTINRMVLDFDFEKACSVTGNNFNVYACLVCGKYFQGRGKHTQAYTHSLQEGHHVYMNLSDGRVYCLPDGYEVVDASLHDIQNMLNPSFEREKIATLDTVPVYARGVDGSDYMPGLIGLNNIKNTDFVNVVVQSLARVPPLRDFFLLPSNYERYQRSALVREFGALVRKMWSPYAARNSLRRNFRRRNSAVQFSEAPPPPLSGTTSRVRCRRTSCCRRACTRRARGTGSACRATRWISSRGCSTRSTPRWVGRRRRARRSSTPPSRAPSR